jgi:DNA recombination protein RmuC
MSGLSAATLLLLLLGLGLALAVGALAGHAVATSRARVGAARLEAERDLLAERLEQHEAQEEAGVELAAAIAPVTSSMARLERHVGELERERVEQYGRLGAQLASVQRSGEALRDQTAALAGALRSPNVRGAWGEVQLRRVVEHAGMLERVDFDTQATGVNRDGDAVRPDAVVHLPGGKHVVVDAKAPLAAFLNASAAPGGINAAGHAERVAEAAREHARALRGHVDALAAKKYWTAFDPTPEIVVCFVPGESFLAAACEADPALLEHAMGRRVVLATPTTLLALLRTVAITWQQAALADGARELFELGRELYARLGTLGEHTGKLGRTLGRAVDDYNKMVGALETRVLVSARRMAQLDITDTAIDVVQPLEQLPRPLTSPELLDLEPLPVLR